MRRDKALKYFKFAQYQAELFSKDPCKKVGAIILAPESMQILSLGYNGMPRNVDETRTERWERPMKYKYVEHAERNALYNAVRHGTPLEGSIAIVSMYPCCDCARGLIQSGIRMIITKEPQWDHERWGDDFKISCEMFMEADVEVVLLTDTEISQ